MKVALTLGVLRKIASPKESGTESESGKGSGPLKSNNPLDLHLSSQGNSTHSKEATAADLLTYKDNNKLLSAFTKALTEGYAIAAFNVYNLEGAKAAVAAAESCNSPVILQVSFSKTISFSLSLSQSVSLSFSLSFSLYFHLSLSLSVSLCFSLSLPSFLSVYLCLYPFIYLPIYQSIFLSFFLNSFHFQVNNSNRSFSKPSQLMTKFLGPSIILSIWRKAVLGSLMLFPKICESSCLHTCRYVHPRE